MAVEVLMPVITEAGDDGVVTAWMVDEGSRVTAGLLIAEVQAEKVAEDVRAPVDGVVRDLVPINQPVPQGRPICVVAADEDATPPAPAAAPPEPAEVAVRVAASPAAKRFARERGVDLTTVAGTGSGGRITEADVEAAAAAGTAGPTSGGFTGLRAVIARNMRESSRTTAPVTITTQVDVTETLHDHITAWIVHLAARALNEHPELNGTRDGDRFFPADAANIALAIQTDEGLVAPVLSDPAGKTPDALAAEIAALAERARTRRLSAADFDGGTFTITNLGHYGVDAFTPIVNIPQIAILGVGALRTAPGFDDEGAVVARSLLTLSLTFDHAFVDGAPAAAFLARLRRLLEEGAG